jgi:hypothetical protein
MHHLHTVYSTLDNPPNTWSLTVGYIFLMFIIGFCIVMYWGIGRKWKVTLRGGLKVNPFLAAIPLITIFSLLGLNILKLKIDVYQHDKALLDSSSKELKLVDGVVQNYSPEEKEGHGNEEFTVKGILFHYSHFEEGRSGYNKTYWYGGVVRQNLYVKITYYYDGDRNAILKLETE